VPVATNFADTTARDTHYVAHGSELETSTPEEYEDKARAFLCAALTDNPEIEEGTRTNGEILRYHKSANEFAVMQPDGTIKTYFKPMRIADAPPNYPRRKMHGEPTNYDYFLRECKR